MRARLLDMGEVGPIRSQSLCHAVAATLRPGDIPVVILVHPSSAYVAVGHRRDAAGEIDLDFCRRRRLPVIRPHVGEAAVVRDANQLLLFLAVHRERAAGLGLPPAAALRWQTLAGAPAAACRALGVDVAFHPSGDLRVEERRIGDTAMAEIGEAVCFAASLNFDVDEELATHALREIGIAATGLRREMAPPPELPAMAEALIAACESCFGLELVPSMPTPEEMDAIYEWDERLVAGGAPEPLAA